ncbi:hypothetical protein BLNAU_22916 [Blattamonas nauphoetae]|uniref:t-SNARE coiled-coil homology domain-containing protein n=1 Tax=Blattamonas nauphoetae TaxID=2049346 RepID=A0ABQ9WST5_9EUKA|nr:hypothetical protein BLNAU_22916 [Blattamonas nauphoetae]
MSVDPYPQVHGELVVNESEIRNNHSQWKNSLKNGTYEDIMYAKNQLHQQLDDFTTILKELREGVEGNVMRYNVTPQQLQERLHTIDTYLKNANAIEKDLNSKATKELLQKKQKEELIQNQRKAQRNKLDEELINVNQSHITNAQMEQETIERQQDQKFDDLHQNVARLTEIANVMSDNLDEDTERIERLSGEVEQNKDKIGILNKTVDKVRNMKNKGKWCIIIALVIVLIVLLVILFNVIF